MALKGLWGDSTVSGNSLLNSFPAGTNGVGDISNSAFSVCAWVRIDVPVEDATAQNVVQLSQFNNVGTSERGLWLHRPSGSTTNRIGFYGFDTNQWNVNSDRPVPVAIWTHIAFAATAGSRYAFFINGVPEYQTTSRSFFASYGAGNVRATFGAHAGGGYTVRKPRYRAAHVAMWDIELEPSDMAALASGRLLPTQIAFGNCMAYFPLVGSLQNLKHPTFSANAPTITDLTNNNWRLTDEDPLRLIRPQFGVSRARFAPAAAPPPSNNNNNLLLLGVGD